MTELVITIIIAHKEILSENEKKSFQQCYKILNRYPIKLVCPSGLNISEYQKLNPYVNVDFIDPKWQSTYEMFNRLKTNTLIYKKFQHFKYILFYELDAWVFNDEVRYWCAKKYEYIGAPWQGEYEHNGKILTGVGNGGFSLRNIKACLAVLRKLRLFEVLLKYSQYSFKGLVPKLWKLYTDLEIAVEKPSEFELQYHFQEDVFWCVDAPTRLASFKCRSSLLRVIAKNVISESFKIAPVEVARQFSFEVNPKKMYQENNFTLPFGCHAWEKYDPLFWKQFIETGDTTI